ncbi:Eco57I restriction-modification methylase domain-containing protein [Flavobacterium sp. DG2-3]|uniref:Eco57I restriction-modification methylase domain-containing protein n=1 Tax=Flavobacterium sp. DG2-3 TaxID=3068317 RepID=UPI00273E4EFC|nr:N-6 DNA methylase [Flavobacterium sp. DG2-3]MDP5202353.1 N-6 DNA methylase [Flavobacterium sp. DG2-3]
MKDKKRSGSYYTPKILSDFLVSHISNNYLNSKNLSILEPSCGDGQFISSFFSKSNLNKYNSIDLTICDIDKSELNKTVSLIPKSSKLKAINDDYLNFFLNNKLKYSLIFGNPPYVRKKNMEENQILNCEAVHLKMLKYNSQIKTKSKINNLWTAFVESAIMSLKNDGIMCFVIPAEIMHVNYTKELRKLIQNEFDRVEIFAFNELIFEGIQQDVVALIGIKGIENKLDHGVSFYQVESLEDLNEPRFTELHSNIHRFSLDKWTNYILSDEDLNFIEGLKNQFKPIKEYCEKAQVGIVSAANDYFIIRNSEVLDNQLNEIEDLIKPILPKGSILSNSLDFTKNDYKNLLDKNERVSLVQFPNIPKTKLNKIAIKYILKGEEKKDDLSGELHKRYKMTKRENWYHIPSIWYSEGLFVKRSHLFPKIIVNSADALVTDSFYRLQTKDPYNIKNLAFSFYNTLTFVLAELEGRFYGGGVLELVPNEFKNLSIPYCDIISEDDFTKLDNMIRENQSIHKILNFTDNLLLKNIDNNRLREIWIKLVNRRIKKNNTNKSKKNNNI